MVKALIIANNSALLFVCGPVKDSLVFLLSPSPNQIPNPALASGFPLFVHAPSVYTLITGKFDCGFLFFLITKCCKRNIFKI